MSFIPRGSRILSRLGVVRFLLLKFGQTYDGVSLSKIPYIFIVGFNKMGTRSLTSLFVSHGIPSVHWDRGNLARSILENQRKGRRLLSGYDKKFLVYSDFTLSEETRLIEANQFYPTLFSDYPGAVFILNTRPTEKWLDSRARHGSGRFLSRTMKSMGTEDPNVVMDHWATSKDIHENEVREFFKDKPNQFVEVDIESEDVAAKLSSVLPFTLSGEIWSLIGRERISQSETSIEVPVRLGRDNPQEH
jgi:hypothetical protein